MIQIPLLDQLPNLLIKTEGNKRKVWDIVRKKWIVLNPEEMVRQAWIHYLQGHMHYPIGLLSVEKQLKLGSLVKRYDLVVYDQQHRPWMLVECKAPDIPVNEKTLHQLLQYQSQIFCPYWLLSNGIDTFCAHYQQHQIEWVTTLPQHPSLL